MVSPVFWFPDLVVTDCLLVPRLIPRLAIFIYLLAVIRVMMVIGDVSALGGFIMNGESISILDGG